MESKLINNSTFCICSGSKKEQVKMLIKEPILYNPYETGAYKPYSSEVDQAEETTLEDCMKCGKQVNKRIIYLQLIQPVYENQAAEV